MSTPDLVTHVWNWITTVGGVIWQWAFARTAATYSALFSGGALLIAARAYRRQVDQTRRAQASMITMHHRTVDQDGPPELIVVSNFSDLPIFDVRLRAGKQEHLLEVELESDTGHKIYRRFPRVPPHSSGTLEVSAGVDADAAVVEFYDGAHRRWRRGLHGGLCEIRTGRWPPGRR